MSSHFHPRIPAFPELRPAEPRFVAASPVMRDMLGRTVTSGGWERMVGRLTEPAGYYRLVDEAGSGLFAKVIPKAHVPRQMAADRLAAELGHSGIAVIVNLPGFPLPFDAGHSVFAYPYFPARFAAANDNELLRIGACIGNLHLAMAELDCREKIRAAAADRIAGLLARRHRIVAEHPGASVPEPLRRMLLEQGPLLQLLHDQNGSQPIHGDLVYANILLPLRGGPPVVIDFEDALISWHPPVFDLALVVERFALEAEADDARAFDLAAALLRGYRSVTKGGRFGVPLRSVLELLALRALLVLADIEAAGGSVEPAEWRKFFRLHEQAGFRVALLERLDSICDD